LLSPVLGLVRKAAGELLFVGAGVALVLRGVRTARTRWSR